MSLNSRAALLSAACAATLLGGCAATESFLGGDRIDYKTEGTRNQGLEVPPDLTQLSRDTRYKAPGGVVSASQVSTPAQVGTPVAATAGTVAPQQLAGMRLERAGQQRWLFVPLPPERLWPELQAFWAERGFVLESQSMEAGVMETAWAENRAKLPQDGLRRAIGAVLDSLYSTGERDRFRTRLERTAQGTEVYITHRGLEEVINNRVDQTTVWQPRPTDPQLEAEMLARLMAKLGGAKEAAQAAPQAAAIATPVPAQPAALSGTTQIVVAEGFDRAWRRVGLALDRAGYSVEDRDRAAGVYFVRQATDAGQVSGQQPGFFSRLFGTAKDKAPATARYRVHVSGAGTAGASSTVTVQDDSGKTVTDAVAQRLLGSIANDLR